MYYRHMAMEVLRIHALLQSEVRKLYKDLLDDSDFDGFNFTSRYAFLCVCIMHACTVTDIYTCMWINVVYVTVIIHLVHTFHFPLLCSFQPWFQRSS